MRTGKAKFFNEKKKFGFIIDDETGNEYYVHVKDITGKIKENDRVRFELKPVTRGYECIMVTLME